MKPGVPCRRCTAPATVMVSGRSVDGRSWRLGAACFRHESAVRRWAAEAGPLTIRPLARQGWRQLISAGTEGR